MVTVNETNREPDGTFEALEATDAINTADISAAAEDDVLKKGSGSDFKFGTVQSEPNVPDWTLDIDTFNFASDTHTFNLNSTYDVVEVYLTVEVVTDAHLYFQFNGVTSEYVYADTEGNTTFNTSRINCGYIPDGKGKFAFRVAGGEQFAWTSLLPFTYSGATFAENNKWNDGSLNEDISSITVFADSGEDFRIGLEAYGRNIKDA